ncbi:PAS domain-containing protein [Hymenobacter taeanensis]|uniref:histidine kinase n=1 Tax=Hymenobacter taeanensis TaxID=2735321 RepID=A0A6M6BCI5_9BACT|nr:MULTISPECIES: PAS domain-containing protein [Hymenobacter]QJX45640.1 PAS domain-containing protein [Hymenobacter taeanensis]UOQ79476.1 PAS domain-containing protein [Hymenobacter sp. 5414T-23]
MPSLDIDALLHQLPGNYILLTPDNIIIDASDDYLAVTLKQRADIVGRNILEAYTAAEQNEWQVLADSFEQVRRLRQPFTMPLIRYDLQRTDGQSGYEERYWQATNYPILDADGALLYILRRTRDVTEAHLAELQRRRMAQELAESQQRAQFILQVLPVMVWTSQPNGDAETFNERWLQFTGRTPEQERGHGWQEGIHSDDRAKVTKTWQEAAAAKTKYQLEYRLRCADGSYRWVLAQSVPRVNAEGEVTMWIGCATDIHDQRQLVQELLQANEEQMVLSEQAYQAHQLARSQRESFYELFLQAPALIAVVRGPEYRYEFVNPRYQELFPDRELLGRTVAEAVPEAVEQGFIGLLDEVYRSGEPYRGNEVLLQLRRHDSGQLDEVYLNFTYQALREHGHIVGISCFAFDVTELVIARQQLEQLLNRTPNPEA